MKWCARILMLSLILLLLVPFGMGQKTHIPLPADLQGELEGVPYRIVVPANWNGTLLVYAHGYNEEQTPPLLAPLPGDVDVLLAEGFALAASRFAVPGFTIKEGMQNSDALTSAFNGLVGRPLRTIIWGKSMGGLITLGLIEKFPGHFDAAIPLCAPGAGAPRRWDQALDLAVAYKVIFGWDPNWGTPGDLRNDLSFVNDVMPNVLTWIKPQYKPMWEAFRVLNHIPPDTFYSDPMNRLLPLFFATQVRASVEVMGGGPVAQNAGRQYLLTPEETAYLKGWGIDTEALLLKMKAEAIYKSKPNARNYVEHYYDPTGRITRPVLTMHTEGDPIATPNHEAAYRLTIDAQGNGNLLLQKFVTGGAHCTFTTPQDMAVVQGMMYWLDTGTPPGDSFFPPLLGFDAAYLPPEWPW